ncbi:hypothetical protein T440DRAFT_509955 [Plenodomus tracheiphilus IPT5]|uniref:SAGA-associated factor 11 n=1 Tax=Plenodomus tracheiphilus IPT5 TaxID=1408161 RepID=A0A6A7AX95_9PLEO|nr:hypothetical protein T440DRAFT_509955 [Plenodomus tracheiphilus IPT5]
MADSSKKRKQAVDHGSHAKRPRFPQKPQHNIAATPTRNAYPNGEVNVRHFLESHEHEIKSLEHAMRAAKQGLTRRAFQDVPRELRRRTASHNPQRVPKRLRARSKQEAKEDNTPISRGTSGSGTGKGKVKFLRKEGREKSRQTWEERAKKRKNEGSVKALGTVALTRRSKRTAGSEKAKSQSKAKHNFPALATPATPPSRFRKRQKNKTWLPTHVWHSKRARMTDPKDPLWGFAIPFQPVVKAYRLTHRAATQRGAVAWDTSYISTLALEGLEASIVGLLRGLDFGTGSLENPWQDRGRAKKWRLGTRSWEGWICRREAKPAHKLAQVTIIWCAPDPRLSKRKVLVRVHPAAFLAVWREVITVAKAQKPCVTVQDLRFEIGSIEITGSAAAATLTSVLIPTVEADVVRDTPRILWTSLAPITDTASLPAGALLAFDVSDPRLRDPPTTSTAPEDQCSLDALTELLASWPIDMTQTASSIFDRQARMTAARSMPSQKSINRRKSECTLGAYPEAKPSDPRIPTLVYTSRISKTWTVLLPWKCVMPVWRGLMRYPISTGGNPRFGGLKERRQINFEQSVPYFPYDCPGTDAGWTWEMRERTTRKHSWTKRPKGKRIEWTTIDLGNGRKGEVGDPWACEWTRLCPGGSKISEEQPQEVQFPVEQLTHQEVLEVVGSASPCSKDCQSIRLFTVKLSMMQRGTPTDCARIYRLPTNNSELRAGWLALIPPAEGAAQRKKQPSGANGELPAHLKRRALARALVMATERHDGPPKAGEQEYPVVPGEEDLIGFVTTGNYNLCEGVPTAIANLALDRVLGAAAGNAGGAGGATLRGDGVCIVRQAGSTIGRLASTRVYGWACAAPYSPTPSTPVLRNHHRHLLPAPTPLTQPPRGGPTGQRATTMSEDRPADAQDEGVAAAVGLPAEALAELTRDILDDVLSNVVFSTALSCHRAEKLLRMQSAATQAESIALANLEPQSQKQHPASASASTIPTAETTAAKYDNGRVFLKGNPLKTTPEILCPHCKLPRLMHPIMGKGMQTPDLTKEYCMLYPWVQRPGHDVYGNPFPTDMAKSKKERELIKQQQKHAEKESVGTPGSQDTDMATGDTKEIKLNTGGKPASYIPWHTCPNCKRSLLITRFAQHLEKCLGISGRQSSRNAMAKLVGHNGSGSGLGTTPLGSRMGTPAPASQDAAAPMSKGKGKGISPIKRLTAADDDMDELADDTPERKKIKKKSSYVKKADRDKPMANGTLKVKLKTGRPDLERKQSEASERSEGKRDREGEDSIEAPQKKKIKLSLNKPDNSRTSASVEPASAVDD